MHALVREVASRLYSVHSHRQPGMTHYAPSNVHDETSGIGDLSRLICIFTSWDWKQYGECVARGGLRADTTPQTD